MRYNFALVLLVLCGCAVAPTDVGRVEKDSFETKRRSQEELILRQQEIIRRQERELKDVERQRYYNEQYRKFEPQE